MQGAGGQQVALVLGGLGRFMRLQHRRLGEIGQGSGGGRGGLVQAGGAVGGLGEGLAELDPLGLDHHGEVFLVGADLVGDLHQRGALPGEGILHRADLVADPQGGGLQPGGLAGEVVAGGLGRLGSILGGGGEVGRARGEGSLGLADLGLGEVGRLGHHAGLAGDGLTDLARAGVEHLGQPLHALAFLRQPVAQALRGADGAFRKGAQPPGLASQGTVQAFEVRAGPRGGVVQGFDLLAHAGSRGVGLGGATEHRLEDLLGQFVGAPGALGDVQSLAQAVGGDPEEADGDQGEDQQQGDAIGLQVHRAQRPLVTDGIDRQHRPQHRGGGGQDIDKARGAGSRGCSAGGSGQGPGRRRRLGRPGGRKGRRVVGLDQLKLGQVEIFVERDLGTAARGHGFGPHVRPEAQRLALVAIHPRPIPREEDNAPRTRGPPAASRVK